MDPLNLNQLSLNQNNIINCSNHSNIVVYIDHYKLITRHLINALILRYFECFVNVIYGDSFTDHLRLMSIWRLKITILTLSCIFKCLSCRQIFLFAGFGTCPEEHGSGFYVPWFSLSYYMAVKLGVSEPAITAV